MRCISSPEIDHTDVINNCINSIEAIELRDRLKNIIQDLIFYGSDYQEKANQSNLFSIPKYEGKDEDIVLKNVTKKELINLYTEHMVPSKKPSRKFYDKIKISAELGICPFCGFGHVNTPDHFLPKSKYPLVSILPLNLIPCCTDCNKGKTARVATREEEQSLHPYFTDSKYINDQWIYATVEHTIPAVIKYYAAPPSDWEQVLIERAINHFNDYHLESRFSVQAGNELASLIYELQIDYDSTGIAGVRNSLVKKALAASAKEKNSWRTAMYQALSEDEWFYSGGFLPAENP
ncbi:hypothetical protein ACU36R_04735 [Pectobacterium brasiliense]|uniref:hypothetical protein n=1 Tax=Pectobacterium brasiliense TaxID=180957 RepID=UPI00406C2E3A